MNFFTSFVVQNPWGFIALLGLVVPIVLHLLSKSQPIQIKFSNIALIDTQQPKSMRKVRLTEFWLLLLRLLLLLFSILLLAQLFLTKPLIKNEEIYLVSADWLNQSSTTQRQQLIEQALKQPVYFLNRKTKLITDDEIIQWQPKPSDVQSQNILQTENILKNLVSFSELLAPETDIKFFVTDRAAQYKLSQQGHLYNINNTLEWHILNTSYQADAQYVDAMNVVLIYDQDRFEDVKYFQKAFALIKQETATQLSVSYFSHNSLEKSEPYQQAMNNKPNWIFYLSSQKLNHKIMQALSTGTNLFVDAQNSQESILLSTASEINNNSTLLGTEARFYQRALPLDVTKQLSPKPTSVYKETLWQLNQPDGASADMLTKTTHSYQSRSTENRAKESTVNESNAHESTVNESNVYQLYSRFSASWSNLIVSKQFPLLLQSILFQQWQINRFVDQQTLTHTQITQLVSSNEDRILDEHETVSFEDKAKNNSVTPRLKSAEDIIVKQQSNENYWTEFLSLLIIILWSLERIASEYYRRRNRSKTKTLVFAGASNIDNIKTHSTSTVSPTKVDV